MLSKRMKSLLIFSFLLLMRFGIYPVSAQTNPGELSSDQFEDPLDKCQVCHAEIYEQWDGYTFVSRKRPIL